VSEGGGWEIFFFCHHCCAKHWDLQ